MTPVLIRSYPWLLLQRLDTTGLPVSILRYAEACVLDARELAALSPLLRDRLRQDGFDLHRPVAVFRDRAESGARFEQL